MHSTEQLTQYSLNFILAFRDLNIVTYKIHGGVFWISVPFNFLCSVFVFILNYIATCQTWKTFHKILTYIYRKHLLVCLGLVFLKFLGMPRKLIDVNSNIPFFWLHLDLFYCLLCNQLYQNPSFYKFSGCRNFSILFRITIWMPFPQNSNVLVLWRV